MPKTRHTFATASAIALAVIATMAITMLLAPLLEAASPDCPADWPEEPQPGAVPVDQYGRITHEGFHTDANGARWYVIRGTDSAGNTVARAYRADDRYAAGYAPSAPDETCYARLRRAGDDADIAEPAQVTFPPDREDPVDATVPPPDTAEPLTLRQLLDAMTSTDRRAAVLCLLNIAGNIDPDTFLDDPDNVQPAIDAGCIPPQ